MRELSVLLSHIEPSHLYRRRTCSFCRLDVTHESVRSGDSSRIVDTAALLECAAAAVEWMAITLPAIVAQATNFPSLEIRHTLAADDSCCRARRMFGTSVDSVADSIVRTSESDMEGDGVLSLLLPPFGDESCDDEDAGVT